MRVHLAALGIGLGLALSVPSSAQSETREAYLERLRDICSVECLKPKEFRRKARKKASRDKGDMAVMIDVREVRRSGDTYQLLSRDLTRSNLVVREILGSAGINTSSSNGIGGLPSNQPGNTSPDLIIIELDEQAFTDFLNVPRLAEPSESDSKGEEAGGEDGLVVEGKRDKARKKPSLADLRSFFYNRRIVVRGKPRLTATWVGARLDHRRKQVTLEVDNAEDLALLPRYDEDGNPIAEQKLGR